MVFACKDGPTGGVEPESYQIVFNNLWQLAGNEEADRRLAIAKADQLYIVTGVVTPTEVGDTRFGDETYVGDTIHLDEDARAAAAPTTEDHLAGQANELKNKTEAPGELEMVKAQAAAKPTPAKPAAK